MTELVADNNNKLWTIKRYFVKTLESNQKACEHGKWYSYWKKGKIVGARLQDCHLPRFLSFFLFLWEHFSVWNTWGSECQYKTALQFENSKAEVWKCQNNWKLRGGSLQREPQGEERGFQNLSRKISTFWMTFLTAHIWDDITRKTGGHQ